MSITALKKAAESSKVLLFAIYAVAISAAMYLGKIPSDVWIDKLEVGFGLLMGGYSAVETARAIFGGKVKAADALADPKAAMAAAKKKKTKLVEVEVDEDEEEVE